MDVKKCPFCGSDAKSETLNLDSGQESYVGCSNLNRCNAQPMVGASTLKKAIAAWNTRTPDREKIEGLVDKLIGSVRQDEREPDRYTRQDVKQAKAALLRAVGVE